MPLRVSGSHNVSHRYVQPPPHRPPSQVRPELELEQIDAEIDAGRHLEPQEALDFAFADSSDPVDPAPSR